MTLTEALVEVFVWWLATSAFVAALYCGVFLWREGCAWFTEWLDDVAGRIS